MTKGSGKPAFSASGQPSTCVATPMKIIGFLIASVASGDEAEKKPWGSLLLVAARYRRREIADEIADSRALQGVKCQRAAEIHGGDSDAGGHQAVDDTFAKAR